MDAKTATTTINHIRALQTCPGWTEWFLKLLATRKEELKTANIAPQTPAAERDTNSALHTFILELERKPAEHLQHAQATLREKETAGTE